MFFIRQVNSRFIIIIIISICITGFDQVVFAPPIGEEATTQEADNKEDLHSCRDCSKDSLTVVDFMHIQLLKADYLFVYRLQITDVLNSLPRNYLFQIK